MRAFLFRICLTLINIFFPPLSVAMIAGPDWDCMLNCILFLCGVLPSHVHGFYISCTYFHRRRKVKKGQWPGGPKALIHSQNVINGGASPRQAEELYLKQFGGVEKKRVSSSNNNNKRDSSRDGYDYDMHRRRRGSARPVGRGDARVASYGGGAGSQQGYYRR